MSNMLTEVTEEGLQSFCLTQKKGDDALVGMELDGTVNKMLFKNNKSSGFWSPYGRRQLQLEPWTPHWSTRTHTSTFPFHGPRGGGGQGSPPACPGTPSKPAVRQTRSA